MSISKEKLLDLLNNEKDYASREKYLSRAEGNNCKMLIQEHYLEKLGVFIRLIKHSTKLDVKPTFARASYAQIKEAFKDGYYEGAGDDAWYIDHNCDGSLVEDASVHKHVSDYMSTIIPENEEECIVRIKTYITDLIATYEEDISDIIKRINRDDITVDRIIEKGKKLEHLRSKLASLYLVKHQIEQIEKPH